MRRERAVAVMSGAYQPRPKESDDESHRLREAAPPEEVGHSNGQGKPKLSGEREDARGEREEPVWLRCWTPPECGGASDDCAEEST